MVHLEKQINKNIVQSREFPRLGVFVLIMSMMMSLTALSIDAMLPALPQIALDLGVESPNDRQLIISAIFLGSSVGQLFFGPLSDNTGRKRAISIGYALYIAGSLICLTSVSFPMMLGGRLLQGFGISSSQSVLMALVRDHFEGRRMAQVMSFSMMVFILVPMIAPTLGQFIISAVGWRAIFSMFMLFAIVAITWFLLSVPETLSEENRASFSIPRIFSAFKQILKIPSSVGFAVSGGLLGGVFQGYLISSQQIFQEQYALGDKFPTIFAIISLSLGAAALANSQLVMRYGMRKLVHWAIRIQYGIVIFFFVFVLVLKDQPSLIVLVAFFMLYFFFMGILTGNMNTLAMQPLAHLAGVGAAALGSSGTLMGMTFGTLIGRAYNGTITPLVVGMVLLSTCAVFIVRWAQANYQESAG